MYFQTKGLRSRCRSSFCIFHVVVIHILHLQIGQKVPALLHLVFDQKNITMPGANLAHDHLQGGVQVFHGVGSTTAHFPLQSATLLSQHYHYLS